MKFNIKFIQLIRELLVVFIGVFAAFLLNDYRNDKNDERATEKTYEIIYRDLDNYYLSGRVQNENGFINLFQDMVDRTHKVVESNAIPDNLYLIGDYWEIGLINSMLLSGKMNEIETEIFVDISKFHSVHKNMINSIQDANSFYDEKMAPNLSKAPSEFYNPTSKELKIQYKKWIIYQENILALSQVTVGMAEDLKAKIKSKYL